MCQLELRACVQKDVVQIRGRLRLKCDGTVQKPDFFSRRNVRVHLNRRGRQFSRLLTAEVCASAVVMVAMLDTPCFLLVRHRVPSHLNWTLHVFIGGN